jgi:hypothetical protein
MAAFLVDPFTRSITDVEETLDPQVPLLENMRQAVGAMQLTLAGVAGGQLVMAIDSFGLLKRQQAFWHFIDGGSKIAGKALLFAVDQETGMIAPVRPDALEALREGIVFDEGVTLVRVEETILHEPGQLPMIARIPVFSDDPNPAVLEQLHAESRTVTPRGDLEVLEASEARARIHGGSGWLVKARADGSVAALRYVLDGEELRLAEVRSAGDVKELRTLMPPGLTPVEPGDDEEPDVIELWLEPLEAASEEAVA